MQMQPNSRLCRKRAGSSTRRQTEYFKRKLWLRPRSHFRGRTYSAPSNHYRQHFRAYLDPIAGKVQLLPDLFLVALTGTRSS
jgi:hypothetical protein